MQDLEVIQRQNAKAVKDAVPALLAQGKYVVKEYLGLHVIDVSAWDTLEQAEDRKNSLNATIGERGEILSPTGTTAAA